MYVWEIPCRTIDDQGDAVFRVNSFGSVLSVDPPASAFADLRPLDVFGFVSPGSDVLHGDLPELLVEDVLRSGEDVVGKAVAMRGPTGAAFVAAAIVNAPIRLVSSDQP